MVNRVTLIGFLTSDARKRVTRDGTELAHVEVQTRQSLKTDDGARHDHVEHHEVTVWSQRAQLIGAQIRSLIRGCLVFVEGRIQSAHRRVSDGTEIDVKRIMASRIRIISSPDGNQETLEY